MNDNETLTIDWPAALSAAKQILRNLHFEADLPRILEDPATRPELVRALRVAMTIPGIRGGGAASTRALLKRQRRSYGGPRKHRW